MTFKVIFDGQGMVITSNGKCDQADLRKANEDCWEHPDFYNTRYQVWDMSESEGLFASEEDALITAKLDNVAFNQFRLMKIAIVTQDEKVTYFAEIYAQHIDQLKIQCCVFKTMDEAILWAQKG